MSVSSKDQEVGAKDQTCVAVSSCWSLSSCLSWLVFIQTCIHNAIILLKEWLVANVRLLLLKLLSLLHLVVVLVEALVSVLNNEGIHHRDWCGCSQKHTLAIHDLSCSPSNRCFSCISWVCLAHWACLVVYHDCQTFFHRGCVFLLSWRFLSVFCRGVPSVLLTLSLINRWTWLLGEFVCWRLFHWVVVHYLLWRYTLLEECYPSVLLKIVKYEIVQLFSNFVDAPKQYHIVLEHVTGMTWPR